jgi:citronellol/citronellal dehydrogenase
VHVLRSGVHAGRSAFISGAGSGIGRGIALRLMALGMNVFGTGRRVEARQETARLAEGLAGRFGFEPCNVRDTEAVEALVRKVGDNEGIDLLVNNAGGQFFAPATGISRKGWDAVIDVNLSAVFVVTKAAYPYLKAREGAVVSISLSGVDRGSMGIAHSIAARAGVLGLTRTLALEWARDGIALNCIGPGAVITEGLAGEAAKAMLDLVGRGDADGPRDEASRFVSLRARFYRTVTPGVAGSSPVHSADLQKRAFAARSFFLPPFAPPSPERRVRPRQEGTGSSVHAAFDLLDAGEHGIEFRHLAEDHARHRDVVGAQRLAHGRRWRQGEGAVRCRRQTKVSAAEEQPRMRCAVCGQSAVVEPPR